MPQGVGTRYWSCQNCNRYPLEIVGTEERPSGERSTSEPTSKNGPGNASVFGASAMDNSFVVLPKNRPPPPSTSTRTRPIPAPQPLGGSDDVAANLPNRPRATERWTGGGAQMRQNPEGVRGMEESFVVLPPGAGSMYGQEGRRGGGGSNGSNGGLDARMTALTKVFQIASHQTQVDHPLCTECMRMLQEEVGQQVKEAEEDCAAYETALARLEGEEGHTLLPDEYKREQKQAEEEQSRLEAEIKAVEVRRREIHIEMEKLEMKAKEVDDLALKFWHDYNDFNFKLHAHREERDAVVARTEVARVQLAALQETNVLNDAFHIWHDNEFGTINGFRLGRLPKIHVEWDEINAAWGQATMLLYTMAQTCRLNFSHRILPMGSYPRIADGKTSYDLYGPVNLFWSTRYDKAMILFLDCLKEFAEFARVKDKAAGVPPDKCFKLPYKIEGDKVSGFTVRQSFNHDERWTKALKYVLCDLKWALVWLNNNNVAPIPPPPTAAPSPASHLSSAASSVNTAQQSGAKEFWLF